MTTLDDNIDNDAVGKQFQSNRMKKKKLNFSYIAAIHVTVFPKGDHGRTSIRCSFTFML